MKAGNVWPTKQSYTRQPTLEIHTLGSTALLQAVLNKVCESGVRLAEPGEFTLRAFLAGRIDLTQAEAVLGVIDAQGETELQTALKQLAGGLSKPLSQIRESLIAILAELEAGLDFVEEDIEFISSDQLVAQLKEALEVVEATVLQLESRVETSHLPRVALVGKPNAGKSSLFNALISEVQATTSNSPALVSSQSGTTRDYLTAKINLGKTTCEIVDTAGEENATLEGSMQHAAQEMTANQSRQADVVIRCVDIRDEIPSDWQPQGREILVWTKSDLVESNQSVATKGLICSSLTGEGLTDLKQEISVKLEELSDAGGSGVSSTAVRCGESLNLAKEALGQSIHLARNSMGEELVAAEIRTVLHEIGRVVGAVYTDDILDRIFSQFCIGK